MFVQLQRRPLMSAPFDLKGTPCSRFKRIHRKYVVNNSLARIKSGGRKSCGGTDAGRRPFQDAGGWRSAITVINEARRGERTRARTNRRASAAESAARHVPGALRRLGRAPVRSNAVHQVARLPLPPNAQRERPAGDQSIEPFFLPLAPGTFLSGDESSAMLFDDQLGMFDALLSCTSPELGQRSREGHDVTRAAAARNAHAVR